MSAIMTAALPMSFARFASTWSSREMRSVTASIAEFSSSTMAFGLGRLRRLCRSAIRLSGRLGLQKRARGRRSDVDRVGRACLRHPGREATADPHLLFTLGDLQFGDARLLNEVDEGLQLPEIHRYPFAG